MHVVPPQPCIIFPAIVSCLMAKGRIFQDEMAAEQIARKKAFNLLCFF